MANTATFEYQGHTIVAQRWTNRTREQVRQLTRRLSRQRGDLSVSTAEEFATCIVLPVSGDERIWKRPLPSCTDETLLEALEHWLDDVEVSFFESLWAAATSAQSYDPVTATKWGQEGDPNSKSSESKSSN